MGKLSTLGLLGLGGLGLTCGFLIGGSRSIAQVPTNPPLVAQDSKDGEADRLYKLGVQQVERNENTAALGSLQQALKRYQGLGDRSGQMDTIRYMGWAQHHLKNYPQALAQFQVSLTIARQINSRSGEAKGLNGVAAVHENLKEIDKALVNYETARAIASEIKEVKLEALILGNMITAYRTAGNWPKAIQSAEKNLALRRELKDDQLVTKSLLAMGDLYRSQNSSKENSEQAIKYYGESLKSAEKTHNESDINSALHNIGAVYMNADSASYNFRKAAEYLEKALAGWKSLNNQAMETNALHLLGVLYAGSIGNDGKTRCDQGIGYLEKSIALMQSLKNQSAEAQALNTLSQCYQESKQYQQAINLQEKGLVAAQRSQNRLQEGLGSVDLAKSYRLIGNLSKAEQLAQQGVSTLREIQNYQWEVYALDEISKIYVALGARDRAIEAQNRRVALAYTHDVRLINYGLNAVFISLKGVKKFDAVTYRDQEEKRLRAQLIQHKFSTSLLDLLGPKVIDIKQAGFFAPSGLGRNLRESVTVLGDAHVEAKKYPEAIEFYQSALSEEIDKGDSFSMGDIDLLTKLGDVSQRMNRLKESESYLRLALKYGEMFRTNLGYNKETATKKWSDADRIFLADRKTRNFKQLQRVLVRQDRSNEALEMAEEARARTFVELLAARTTGQPLGDVLPTSPKLEAMRQIAKQRNATLVQYSIVDDNLLYIWVIKPTGEISFRSTSAPAAESLNQLVSNSRAEMGIRGRASIKIASTKPNESAPTDSFTQKNLARLYQLLIDPIAQDLPSDPNQQVIFLPQDELFFVPFAALPDAQGRYLIERHTLSTAPSIQTLEFTQALAQRPKTQKGIVVVGDPKMPIVEGLALIPLPGARQEAINIAQIFQTQPLLGEQATKSTVLQQIKTAKILHLATHGLLDNVRDDMPGAIALAPSGPDNGLLSAGEIFDLKLNLDLVVLSACDTGRGKLTGDGVVGLSRSFFAAGASTVLVSLWSVNDGSTNALMSEFYRQLQTEPNKSKALRQAMLKTRERHPNPIDWAAFTLIGEN
jgi:CHAT domain-containing protein